MRVNLTEDFRNCSCAFTEQHILEEVGWAF
jgi:hypothetical protein